MSMSSGTRTRELLNEEISHMCRKPKRDPQENGSCIWTDIFTFTAQDVISGCFTSKLKSFINPLSAHNVRKNDFLILKTLLWKKITGNRIKLITCIKFFFFAVIFMKHQCSNDSLGLCSWQGVYLEFNIIKWVYIGVSVPTASVLSSGWMKLCVSMALGCPAPPWRTSEPNERAERGSTSVSVKDAITLNVGFGSLSVDTILVFWKHYRTS